MSAITDRYSRTRQLARALFPQWSRRMRAKWVLAKLQAGAPKVPFSTRKADESHAVRVYHKGTPAFEGGA